MANFTKQILIFILIIVCISFILNLFQGYFNLDPKHYKKQYSSAKNFIPTHNINGIILGTSHSTHSLRPKILDKSGITFYNYALNGASPEFNYNWYNRIYRPYNESPSYCLFGVDFFMFDKNWLWRSFEQDAEYFSYEVFFKELFLNNRSNKKDLIINRFPFLKYRSQIKSSLKLKHGDPSFNMSNYDRGYISYSTAFESTRFEPKLKFKVDKIQIEYFKILVNQMISDNIKIFFIFPPEYGIDIAKYNKMESLKIINEIANQYAIPILNYNTDLRSDINKDILLFSDWGHMNHRGAEIFSNKIANDLKDKTNNILH